MATETQLGWRSWLSAARNTVSDADLAKKRSAKEEEPGLLETKLVCKTASAVDLIAQLHLAPNLWEGGQSNAQPPMDKGGDR